MSYLNMEGDLIYISTDAVKVFPVPFNPYKK